MKTIISTSQRANTVRHELIKTSLYNDIQYIPVLVVNTNPQIQHIVQSMPTIIIQVLIKLIYKKSYLKPHIWIICS